MLIPSHRHTESDLYVWKEHERGDRAHAASHSLGRKARQAADYIAEFAEAGPCWCSVSWGKDSTLLAHMAYQCDRSMPLVWIRVEPICNPDCIAVRDEFMRKHPEANYREVVVQCERDESGWHASGTLEAGAASARIDHGERVMLGIRATESTTRALRVWTHGANTERCSAPLGHLTEQDVFALLHQFRLPVHPAYAMLGGGRWQRQHLRVSSLGGRRGDGIGRAEWEREYYGDVLRRLESP